jgi:hypothetical protein
MDDTPPLHPDLAPLACLLGEWAGEGRGEYPTIEPFGYLETVRFGHVGKPFLAYTQVTTHAGTNQPAHTEAGYWRCFPGDSGVPAHIEVVLSHPSGITEILEGSLRADVDDQVTIDLTTSSVSRTHTAKQVTALARQLTITGDVLRYSVSMAAVGQPLSHHLRAELRRV